VGLGYQAVGLDAWEDPNQPGFAERKIEFLKLNLNEPNALQALESCSIDAIVAGEVIEHVLNHPLGVLQELTRSLRPAGVLILTTPNPGTVMNASRILLQKPLLWGTEEFYRQEKFDGNSIICAAHIHYREYQTPELLQMMKDAGLEVDSVEYMPIGSSKGQRSVKRIIKSNAISRKLLRLRHFGSTHYLVARRR
jgi:2-polyprenyl-3-methyl-5-hydroxy-6-metoxy-1,4-benzoquinol methylase